MYFDFVFDIFSSLTSLPVLSLSLSLLSLCLHCMVLYSCVFLCIGVLKNDSVFLCIGVLKNDSRLFWFTR